MLQVMKAVWVWTWLLCAGCGCLVLLEPRIQGTREQDCCWACGCDDVCYEISGGHAKSPGLSFAEAWHTSIFRKVLCLASTCTYWCM